MSGDSRFIALEKLCHLIQCQPYGIIGQLHLQLHYAVVAFIYNDGFVRWLICCQFVAHCCLFISAVSCLI